MSLPKIDVYEFMNSYVPRINKNNLLVNIRGTNGSGKSTIPFSFMNADPYAFELTYYIGSSEKVLATVFPSMGWLAMGSYRTACGGLDSYKTNEQTFDSIKLIWDLDFNIIMEGVISSTVRGSYLDFFTTINDDMKNSREIVIYNLLPPFNICLDRIQQRNGGKPIKSDQVMSKYKTVENNIKYFTEAGLKCLRLDNSSVKKEETCQWFLNSLGVAVECPEIVSKQPDNISEEFTDEAINKKLWVAPDDEISHYDWFDYYKAPNSQVKVNPECFRQYWYWIHERQEIWNKRINLEQKAPWTQDPILRDYKFTHACRNLDKLSIFYIKNILMRLKNTKNSKKEVILNTMIYRLFCRLDTWELFGYLELSKWDSQWAYAKKKLREKKANGEPVFTDAYYVNDLRAANPDPITCHNKTENAICLIEIWYQRLDEIYENVALSNRMKDALDFLKTLPCVGHFTAYELACDFAWCHPYTDVELVKWTIDSYTNVGPGAQRGLRYIFSDRGNLSDLECIIYLRSIANHYLEELGYSDLKMPDEVPELDMRCIEHSLCEYQKYRKAYDGTGRPRVKFTHKTKDINKLKM